ncbi:hypothetical protein Pst134EA_019258 [Puccinia striiformis f. sp. tritici]|uniref:hypothetical protein n=1 Tax=Puccinia striiformis f. sp. tritici TaxID=168172 RepID=UPI002008B1FD|nr:hypothetical protein Pst134EA_019258 [Puccinia striiformis f. sp. tritici]KAH9459107.1 hypothetical protein Pst134EA_019258 [Puccinia striiformis f. sp. tritici]
MHQIPSRRLLAETKRSARRVNLTESSGYPVQAQSPRVLRRYFIYVAHSSRRDRKPSSSAAGKEGVYSASGSMARPHLDREDEIQPADDGIEDVASVKYEVKVFILSWDLLDVSANHGFNDTVALSNPGRRTDRHM